MGVDKNVSYDVFPKQGSMWGKRVKVCFNYDTDRTIGGKIVRDDVTLPYVTIIQLDDGKFVLSTECQFTIEG